MGFEPRREGVRYTAAAMLNTGPREIRRNTFAIVLDREPATRG
jgi:hypothetical protein